MKLVDYEYIFNLLNNNQINDKNEANPDLKDDEDICIFTNCLIEDGYGGFDPFGENPIKTLVRALIFYVKTEKFL